MNQGRVVTESSGSAIAGEASVCRDLRALMARALAVYGHDVGLAIHRAAEAVLVAEAAPRGPILDLGCSDGRFARIWTGFVQRPPKVLGCDVDLPAVRQARAEPGVTRAIAGDGSRLPLRDASMGAVIANSVLAHVPDLDRLLGEVARVLRPGGQFLATVPGPDFERTLAGVRLLRSLGFLWIAAKVGDRYHLRWQQRHRDGEETWARRLAVHGLQLVEARTYPGLRASAVWSATFSLLRMGVGRYTLLNLLRRMVPMRSGDRERVGVFARMLAPLLAEPGTPGASLFLHMTRNTSPVRVQRLIQGNSHLPQRALSPDQEKIRRWLTASSILVQDESSLLRGGYGNLIDGRTGRSPLLYCEITGYAAQFWLRQMNKDAETRAVAAGDCLLRVQAPRTREESVVAGSFPFGLTRPDGMRLPAYFSFDAAVCTAAMVDLAFQTRQPRFAAAALRAGAFLLAMQRKDGTFKARHTLASGHPDLPRMESWFDDGCVLHGKNTIGLLKLWRLTNAARWREVAVLTLDWLCSLQGPRGEFPVSAGASVSMAHTHCYAVEGLLYAGLTFGEDRYLTAGIRGADWLRMAQRRDGSFVWDYLTAGRRLPRPSPGSHVHVGPVAQAARIWWVAGRITPSHRWGEAAERALAFLARAQVRDSHRWGGGAFAQGFRRLGPWRLGYRAYSPWEAMFAAEAARLWVGGTDDPAWSIF